MSSQTNEVSDYERLIGILTKAEADFSVTNDDLTIEVGFKYRVGSGRKCALYKFDNQGYQLEVTVVADA